MTSPQILTPSPILSVRQLSIGFKNSQGSKLLTEQVSFELYPQEILAIVGESGSGKSVTALGLMGVYPSGGGFLNQGEVWFENQDLCKISQLEWRKIHASKMAMIFQEPGAALNPLMKIQSQLLEVLQEHNQMQEAQNKLRESLAQVGLKDFERVLQSYPHELSGGMQQRVLIAMALLLKPKILVADEPTTALDVTVQKQILDLLLDLQESHQMAQILITHHLGLVAQYADRVMVMQNGRIVESGSVQQIIENPRHSYTQSLLKAVPRL